MLVFVVVYVFIFVLVLNVVFVLMLMMWLVWFVIRYGSVVFDVFSVVFMFSLYM